MRRRQHQVERASFVSTQVQLPVRVDVGLDALQKPEGAAGVHLVDRAALVRGLLHRHPAGNLQSMGMIGDRRVVIPTLKTGIGDFLDRRVAVAPFGVHLQIAEILVDGGARE